MHHGRGSRLAAIYQARYLVAVQGGGGGGVGQDTLLTCNPFIQTTVHFKPV